MAEEQRQWVQARNYLLQTLEIFMEYNDNHYSGITVRNLAWLWRNSNDASILAMVAERLELEMEVSEVEELLRKALGEGGGRET